MTDVQPIEYGLSEYGISEPIKIIGSLTNLLPAKCVPIVFLIDEFHSEDGSSNDCIDQNIVNAKELVALCRVDLIGVESHEGGFTWDSIYVHQYYKDIQRNKQGYSLMDFSEPVPIVEWGESLEHVGKCKIFADSVRNLGAKVLGVECKGLLQELGNSLSNGIFRKEDADSDWNRRRSEHHLRTLFELRRHHNLGGNLILNVGGNHNNHIEDWIQNGTIADKAGEVAAYIRVTTPAYVRLFEEHQKSRSA